MTKVLEGRSALITGANQGLGLAIARAFVEAGASVMLCARDAALLDQARAEVAALATGGQRVLAHAADVSSREQVDALAAATLREFPNLQVLVNNAGVYGPMGLTARAGQSSAPSRSIRAAPTAIPAQVSGRRRR